MVWGPSCKRGLWRLEMVVEYVRGASCKSRAWGVGRNRRVWAGQGSRVWAGWRVIGEMMVDAVQGRRCDPRHRVGCVRRGALRQRRRPRRGVGGGHHHAAAACGHCHAVRHGAQRHGLCRLGRPHQAKGVGCEAGRVGGRGRGHAVRHGAPSGMNFVDWISRAKPKCGA
eukprot:364302-Chlamydomonas_euryale.AAC.2